ncbi:hypothetical protein FHR98_000765 [Limibacillus halophilus]|uniref:Uncharacterized protein n=1 Tax=Limibacillus halophilus TaxID=1579333 RepID=A0A839SU90_9PROT|nr:hypothetical protein [Limibacillus halophilus]
MKVKELQECLAALDPNSEVLCYCEDGKFLAKDRKFVVFEVSSVSPRKASRIRLEDRTPYLKIGEGPEAENLVLLDVTSDI